MIIYVRIRAANKDYYFDKCILTIFNELSNVKIIGLFLVWYLKNK